MEGIVPHPKYPKAQVRSQMPWRASIRQLGRRRLALIAAIGIGGTGIGLWFFGAKQSPSDSGVLDLTDGVPTASHKTADGHSKPGR
jgi:hypothetical protein